MKKLIVSALALLITLNLFAVPDEGMWLPLYLKQLNEKDMKEKGLKLSADDIYNINKSSLKDAVVRLGDGFCTAEIVSEQGLMLTNHHCGYDAIAELSSLKQNYLDDGFWAKNKSEEINAPGLTASILVRMEDVTEKVKNAFTGNETPQVKAVKMKVITDSLTKAATAGTHYIASVESFFGGNEYYLLVYEQFRDVRLVGTPPNTIGKFGGDEDNWMWPRHTGDFSVFRIYSSKDGKPADYSTENIPYKPKHHFPIYLGGVKEGDYTMVMGFPGSTTRYLTSFDLELARDHVNPAIIAAFGNKLEVMKKNMDSDPELKLALASEYASLSNGHKYYIGQQRQLKQLDFIDMQRKEEEEFVNWANANDERKAKYGDIIPTVKAAIGQQRNVEPALTYTGYGLFNSGAIQYAFTYFPFYQAAQSGEAPQSMLDSLATALKPAVEAYLDGNGHKIGKEVLEGQLLTFYRNVPAEQHPDFLKKIIADQKKECTPEQAISMYVDELYAESALLNKEDANKFLSKPKYKTLTKDPLFTLMMDIVSYYGQTLAPASQSAQMKLKEAHKNYIAALREWKSDKKFYPDANSTLRVTYGNVKSYYPRDAVFYDYYTTYEGILQKNDPNNPEFDAPDEEIKLLKERKFGRYAQNDTLRVNFLSNNDITGGNSGSPVLDAYGRLVGIAFDGNWESMIGDIYVDPAYNRTISVDIRYVLWVMDTLYGARHLVDEMTIVEK